MVKHLLKMAWDIITFIFLKVKGVEFNFGKIRLQGLPIIVREKGSRIIIEDDVTICSDSKYNVAGINHKSILATVSPVGKIVIGKGSGLSGVSIVAARSVVIAEGVGLGVNVSIWDTDFHPIEMVKRINQQSILDAKAGEVIIGRYAWIGANCAIYKGVSIGEAAVIAANSIVTKSIPSNVLAAGVPARVIRPINND